MMELLSSETKLGERALALRSTLPPSVAELLVKRGGGVSSGRRKKRRRINRLRFCTTYEQNDE